MTCAECVERLSARIDNELSPGEAAGVDQHLATCPDCSRAYARLLETSSRVKGALMRYEAPDVLKARIRASLSDPPREIAARTGRSLGFASTWPRMVAAAAVLAMASSAGTYMLAGRRGATDAIEQEVLSSHVRSLMPGHLTDVASNDQHNVKPWFNGRVNMSPDVPKLDSLGFPLIGGRVDYIDGRNVAAVVYMRRQHVINVFSWADTAPPDNSRGVSTVNGYHFIRIWHDGIETWIVSDLNAGELRDFAKLMFPHV